MSSQAKRKVSSEGRAAIGAAGIITIKRPFSGQDLLKDSNYLQTMDWNEPQPAHKLATADDCFLELKRAHTMFALQRVARCTKTWSAARLRGCASDDVKRQQ